LVDECGNEKYFCMMIRLTNIVKALRQTCWVLLLALYAAAALKVDSIHELVHANEFADLHSVEQENNPCHKSIYHQEAEKGCEHKSHITENTKCPLCEYSSSIDELLTHHAEESAETSNAALPVLISEGFLFPSAFAHADRGPPIIA
jgi:hypothetical protein